MDISLNRKGIEEALECASILKKIELDLAFTSNLVRTQETLFLILSGQKKKGAFIHEKANLKNEIEKIEWYFYPKKICKDIRDIRFSTGELLIYRLSEGRLVREDAEKTQK